MVAHNKNIVGDGGGDTRAEREYTISPVISGHTVVRQGADDRVVLHNTIVAVPEKDEFLVVVALVVREFVVGANARAVNRAFAETDISGRDVVVNVDVLPRIDVQFKSSAVPAE